MKNILKSIVAICIAFITASNIAPARQHTTQPSLTKDVTDYTWYKDEELTDITGTISDINVEVNRLYQLFPSYTFSSSHSMGLYAYEYGYHPYLPIVIIYSNLCC